MVELGRMGLEVRFRSDLVGVSHPECPVLMRSDIPLVSCTIWNFKEVIPIEIQRFVNLIPRTRKLKRLTNEKTIP